MHYQESHVFYFYLEQVLLEDSVTSEKLWFDFNRYVGEMSTEFSKELPVIRPAIVVPPCMVTVLYAAYFLLFPCV